MTFNSKKIGNLLLPVFLLISSFAQAQIVKPPKWTFTLEPKELQVGEQATLVMEAAIPIGWYVYSNDFDKDLGPLLTEFNPATSTDYEISEKLKAINPKKKYEEIWEGDVTYFMGKGRFEQPLNLKVANGTIIGTLKYQMCSDIDGKCINFEEDIEVNFKAAASSPASSEAGENSELIPNSTSQEAATQNPDSVASENETEQDSGSPFTLAETDSEESSTNEAEDFSAEGESESLWGFMVLAFLAGLAALITPCVFPMIPMTVSFFTGRSKSRAQGIRQAFIYGISIIGIYTIAGTAVAAIQGPEFANWLATHWIPNVFFS